MRAIATFYRMVQSQKQFVEPFIRDLPIVGPAGTLSAILHTGRQQATSEITIVAANAFNRGITTRDRYKYNV